MMDTPIKFIPNEPFEIKGNASDLSILFKSITLPIEWGVTSCTLSAPLNNNISFSKKDISNSLYPNSKALLPLTKGSITVTINIGNCPAIKKGQECNVHVVFGK